jgi:hypothetical protein
MTQRTLTVALWCAFAFVAWNVIFDRLVWTAAMEFTQQQVTLHQTGQPVTSIHDGFSPRVRTAAVQASLWTLPIIVTGGIAVYLSCRQAR